MSVLFYSLLALLATGVWALTGVLLIPHIKGRKPARKQISLKKRKKKLRNPQQSSAELLELLAKRKSPNPQRGFPQGFSRIQPPPPPQAPSFNFPPPPAAPSRPLNRPLDPRLDLWVQEIHPSNRFVEPPLEEDFEELVRFFESQFRGR